MTQALALAKQHSLRIVTVQDRKDPAIPGWYVNAYVVYGPLGRIGKRRDPAALLRYIKKMLGIA